MVLFGRPVCCVCQPRRSCARGRWLPLAVDGVIALLILVINGNQRGDQASCPQCR